MMSFMCWGYRLCPVMHETAQSHALRRKTSLRRLRFGSRRSRLFCTRYPRRRRYLKQSNCHIKQQAMVHAHRCRFPLPCETHKVHNLFVLRSVLSRLRLHFAEQGLPVCLIMMYCHLCRFCSPCLRRTSRLSPLPCRHPRGGFLPVAGGFSS